MVLRGRWCGGRALRAESETGEGAGCSSLGRHLNVAVPLVNQHMVGFVSKRVGNYQLHPQWLTLLDQLWVQ